MSDTPSLTPNFAMASPAALNGIADSKATITPTEGLLDLWLHGKSPHTQRYYRREAKNGIKKYALSVLPCWVDSKLC
jgi:integrase/recombinase XerD